MTELVAIQDVPTPVADPKPVPVRFWLVDWLKSDHLRWILLVALYVILQPPEKGLGIELCGLKRLTGSPCPGCGMTRAGANMIRGNVHRSFQFHPFGIVFIPTLFGLAFLSLFPKSVRLAL